MWNKLKTFITVTEQGGLAKAAKKLNVSKATVTRYIQELEAEYQAKLFTRTTRHLSLTEQGELFYHYALELLQLHEAAHDKLHHAEKSVQGHIKLGLPVSILHHFIQQQLPQLARTYPNLSIEIIQGNQISNLLSSHFDLVVHCGPLPDVNFYYEKLADWQKILCASPEYLQQFKTPKSIADLTKHHCLDHADNHSLSWQLQENGKLRTIGINSQIKINSGIALKELAIQGMGMVYLPSFTVSDAISTKKLKPVLKTAWQDPLPIYALYPLRKRENKKIAVMTHALKALFK